MSDWVSPIDETVTLGKIWFVNILNWMQKEFIFILFFLSPSNCFVLSSAKRPLYLTWKNELQFSHFYESDFEMIFKNGDGNAFNAKQKLNYLFFFFFKI